MHGCHALGTRHAVLTDRAAADMLMKKKDRGEGGIARVSLCSSLSTGTVSLLQSMHASQCCHAQHGKHSAEAVQQA